MKTLIIAFILIGIFSISTIAQTDDKTAAIDVVNRLFAGMKAKDAEQIKAAFAAEGQLVAIDKPRDGKGLSKTRLFTGEAFAKMISEAKGGDFIEMMPSPEARVSGDMALVTGRYTFYVGDKFSHCGTNTFNLVRTETGWRIANGASTLEFQCDRDLKAVAVPKIETNRADVSTIDGIIKAFHETISGGKGIKRQWSRYRTLFMRDVSFVAMDSDNGRIRSTLLSLDEYINGSNEFFVTEGFTEQEINRVVRRFSNIAHVFSTFEWWTEDRKMSGRGVKSIELFFDGKRWWISAVSGDLENPQNPIPKEFLPKGKT
jgi:hypothetical protein